MFFSKKIFYYVAITISTTLLSHVINAAKPNLSFENIPDIKLTNENSVAIKRSLSLLVHNHFKKQTLDQNFFDKSIKRYIDNLDPTRMLFLKSDEEYVKKNITPSVIENINSNKINFIIDIYNIYKQRSYEYNQYLLSLLEQKPDLSTDEFIEKDRKLSERPKSIDEAKKLWHAKFKNDVIVLDLKKDNWETTRKTLEKRYNYYITRLKQLKNDDIIQIFLNSITREMDPHTSYLSPKSLKRFEESIKLSMEGIGATLMIKDDLAFIKSFVKGSPADKNKDLSEGDKIIGVAQDNNEFQDIVGWWLDDIVDLIKGPKDSIVRLEVEPKNGGKTKIVTIQRAKIRIEDSAAKLKIENFHNKNIAILEIPSFYENLSQDVIKTFHTNVEKLKNKKIDGIIVDLRNNGGGLLTEAINLSGLFIGKNPIVQVKNASGKITVHQSNIEQMYKQPMIILQNRNSASASEIFAAAMQDYDRAIVVGQNSYGKGTVQQNRTLNSFIDDISLGKLGALQYTIEKFYRVNGESTQLKGVKTDIELPSAISVLDVGEEKSDNALEWDTIPTAKYSNTMFKGEDREYIDTIDKFYQQRKSLDPEYKIVQDMITDYDNEDKEKLLSLNFSKRKIRQNNNDKIYLDRVNKLLKLEGKELLNSIDNIPVDFELPDFNKKQAKLMLIDILNLKNQ